MQEKYSKSEISLHTTKKDCWIVIHGKVYDVTSFLEDHPGGDEVLLQASATGDATQSFEEVGHSSTATSMMQSYLIGSIEGHVESSNSSEAKGTAAASGGVKNKTLLEKKPPPQSSGFSDYLLPLFVLAMACATWYYLTYISGKA